MLNEGHCHGGPMDGQVGQSRFPKGFLLVDKENSLAWVYDWDANAGHFEVRDDDAQPLDEAGRYRAAEEQEYDVRAVDAE